MKKIACVGDSITWGFTLLRREKHSYPAVLQELLGEGWEVHNFGFNDSTARVDSEIPYIKRKVFKKSHEIEPDIVLIMLGSNDTKQINWDPDKFREGYCRIVDSYLEMEHKPAVCLMTPPRIFRKLDLKPLMLHNSTLKNKVIPIIKEVAAERGLNVIELHPILKSRQLYTDGIHPNREGAKMLAEAVYKALLSSELHGLIQSDHTLEAD